MAKEAKIALSTPLQYLKGVGPARAAAFARKGIVTIEDALYYFPRKYEDRKSFCDPENLHRMEEGVFVSVVGKILQQREIPMRNRKQRMFEIVVSGKNGGLLTCTWFNVYKGLKENLSVGKIGVFQGVLKKYRGAPQIMHPDFDFVSDLAELKDNASKSPKSLHWGRIVPIYSRSEKLSQKLIRETIYRCLELGVEITTEDLPKKICDKLSLLSLQDALWQMHFSDTLPDPEQELSPAARRFVFEEFFKFQLALMADRSQIKPEKSEAFHIRAQLQNQLRKNLPYKLTAAQERGIAEILQDLQKPTAMNRIVQGDVGCGKTIVAFFAACEAIEQNAQVAYMTPTEILAEQHYQNALKVFQGTKVEVVLLTGSLDKKSRQEVLEKISSGKAQLIIGTHALIQDSVVWKRLLLAIVDEQHRFGVRQRAMLKEKSPEGLFPHIFTMTATPIPRSLALTLFGDLHTTIIDELPAGRQEITTKAIRGSDRARLYSLITKEAAEGRQTYIVYPLVEDSEKEEMARLKSVESEFHRLQEGPLAGLSMAFVHGRMKSEDRTQIMREFKEGKYKVLVSTTVIEVGVDVPNASVIAIENAERFGLSQLHQLRGRVGRGVHKSYCVLVTDVPPPGTRKVGSLEDGVEEESPWIRLQVLEKNRDGFKIAEEDLKIRGPGDFLGTKQSGGHSFKLANLHRDLPLLEEARKEALALFTADPELKDPENKGISKWLLAAMEEASDHLKSG